MIDLQQFEAREQRVAENYGPVFIYVPPRVVEGLFGDMPDVYTPPGASQAWTIFRASEEDRGVYVYDFYNRGVILRGTDYDVVMELVDVLLATLK